MRSPGARLAGAAACRHFAGDRSGATVVEFALVALPFFALLIAILQTAMIFFASQVLETGVAKAARLVRTGQAQEQKLTLTQFKQAVCSDIFGLLDCANGLKVDVRKYSSFSGADLSSPIDSSGKLEDDFLYQPGAGGDIVVVRAFYEWPNIIPLLGVGLNDLANGNYLLAAAAVFRNEPF
jgi:Flp pilus assembly protein TadG